MTAEEFDLSSQQSASTYFLVDFDKAEVFPGFVPDTWFLRVQGTTRCSNTVVTLNPLVYVQCPEYWGIEVVGNLPGGICMTALGHYDVTIPLAGITGSAGIEVIGANKQEKFEVSGGCDGGSSEK